MVQNWDIHLWVDRDGTWKARIEAEGQDRTEVTGRNIWVAMHHVGQEVEAQVFESLPGAPCKK